MENNRRWLQRPALWLEVFVLANITFLGPDIYLAHETNSFHHPAEYLPWVWQRRLGLLVGWGAVALGIAGLILHLQSHFFREQTLDSLVYTAPFAAPLAYTGLGLLLIMNRMVPDDSPDWPRWVVFLALGGFVGNFIFSLADHAQNGFFHWTEWIPVASSAFAVGFLLAPFAVPCPRSFVTTGGVVMAIQVPVGLLGFYFHTWANLHGPSRDLWNNFIYGTPSLAPLLFPNLAVLAVLGLWVWRRQV